MGIYVTGEGSCERCGNANRWESEESRYFERYCPSCGFEVSLLRGLPKDAVQGFAEKGYRVKHESNNYFEMIKVSRNHGALVVSYLQRETRSFFALRRPYSAKELEGIVAGLMASPLVDRAGCYLALWEHRSLKVLFDGARTVNEIKRRELAKMAVTTGAQPSFGL